MASFEDFLGATASEDSPRGDVASDCLADPGFTGSGGIEEYADDLPEFPADVLRQLFAEWRAEA